MASSRRFQSPLSLIVIACLLNNAHAQLTQEQFENRCLNFAPLEFIVGQVTNTIIITCSLEDGTATNIMWTRESIGISVNISQLVDEGNSKYTTAATRLMIDMNELDTEDEGIYVCHYILDGSTEITQDASCVFILGELQYATCAGNPDNNCMEEIEVTEDDDILFNVSVIFVHGGSSGQRQEVKQLNLYKDNVNGAPIVSCDFTSGRSCTDSPLEIEQIGNNIFDIDLRLPEASMMDAGTYIVSIEANNPSTGGQESNEKTFNVIVNSNSQVLAPSSPTVPSSSITPSNVPTVMVQPTKSSSTGEISMTLTQPIVTTNEPTQSRVSGDDNTVVIAVVVPLSIVLVALLVIAAVAIAAIVHKQYPLFKTSTKPSLLTMTSRPDDNVSMDKNRSDTDQFSEEEKRISFIEVVELPDNKELESMTDAI